eukprot:gene17302-biopygen10237
MGMGGGGRRVTRVRRLSSLQRAGVIAGTRSSGLLSIRWLSASLSLSMAIIATAIAAGLSISTGNKAMEDTKTAGRAGALKRSEHAIVNVVKDVVTNKVKTQWITTLAPEAAELEYSLFIQRPPVHPMLINHYASVRSCSSGGAGRGAETMNWKKM